MPQDSLVPISDEQAKLGQEALKVLQGIGSLVGKALESVPEDVVGYLGGDWLRIRRAENIAKMMKRAKERLEAWGVKDAEPASLTIALPILRGAADESREEIQDLWARLLAAAMDPSRTKHVRQRFADVVHQMDPPDALLLASPSLRDRAGGIQQPDRNAVAEELHISRDELDVTLANLVRLDVFFEPNIGGSVVGTTPFGREFLLSVIKDNT